MVMDFAYLSAIIRDHRLARGLTQKQLAEAAGVSRMTVVKFENGVTDARVAKLQPVLEQLGWTLTARRQ